MDTITAHKWNSLFMLEWNLNSNHYALLTAKLGSLTLRFLLFFFQTGDVTDLAWLCHMTWWWNFRHVKRWEFLLSLLLLLAFKFCQYCSLLFEWCSLGRQYTLGWCGHWGWHMPAFFIFISHMAEIKNCSFLK